MCDDNEGGFGMELEIRALSPALLDDYLFFFDEVGFSDHEAWSGCYCMHFHWQKHWDAEPPRSSRDRAVEHIRDGALRGYLAYADGRVAGWVNFNDREAYAALADADGIRLPGDENRRIAAAVCFLVAPELRGRGIASALLARALRDAAAEGFDCVEAYPPMGLCDVYAAHRGTVSLLERHGFSAEGTLGDAARMRKSLHG